MKIDVELTENIFVAATRNETEARELFQTLTSNLTEPTGIPLEKVFASAKSCGLTTWGAIKFLRYLTGWGLKESKDWVEARLYQ